MIPSTKIQRKRVRALVAEMAAAGVLLAGCAFPWASGGGQPKPLIGVYEQGAPASWAQVATFSSASGVQPRIVAYYSGWYERFATNFASAAWQRNATTIVQIDPFGVTLSSIADGASDSYLRSFAMSVKDFQHPVFLSFGHEMNGGWYPWGNGHVSPSVFIAAWRHIVQVFRNSGASNVRWVWTITSVGGTSGTLREWWPGSSYVDFAGIDGYYYTSSDAYSNVFGTTIDQIRSFSSVPLMISEVGIGPNSNRSSQIATLFSNATADDFYGIIWFDVDEPSGLYNQDWRLEDDKAALMAYEIAVRKCCQLHVRVTVRNRWVGQALTPTPA